jgi:hypothetical protein
MNLYELSARVNPLRKVKKKNDEKECLSLSQFLYLQKSSKSIYIMDESVRSHASYWPVERGILYIASLGTTSLFAAR